MLPSNQPGLYDGRQSLLYKATYWLTQISATGFTPTPPPPDPYDAVTSVFDGTNDYMTLVSGGPTGLIDGNKFTFSTWIKFGSDGTWATIVDYSTSILGLRFLIRRNDDNTLLVFANNSGGTEILRISTTETFTVADGWTHLYVCIDLSDTAKRKIYKDSTPCTLTVTTYNTAGTIDYVGAGFNYRIGARADGAVDKMNAALSEYWWDDSYLDDLTKFVTDGCPIDLGADGSTPTGAAPVFYFKGEGNAFNVNSGTGGNFTVTGTLTTTTPPCS
jgi:hypothetical protein